MENAGNSMLWKKLHDPASVTPRTTRWPPSQNQFPSKYEPVPKIGSGESPRGRSSSKENQIVPLNLNRKSSPGEGYTYRSKMDNDTTEERVRQVEMRLGVSEKSNRALLEEVLRLQNDLRNTSKKSDDVLREERDSRQQLSEAIRMCNELISQLSQRIKDTEDKMEDEKDSLRTLFSHTKNVEKHVVQSQADTQQRRDAQSMRLQELRTELNETKSSKNQLEQVTFALTEELRSLKGRVDTQQVEFGNTLSDMRNRTRKLEEENKLQLDTMRKQTDLHNMTDVTTSQLRGQVETRLSELRDFLMDLRGKYETEQNERRNLEKALQGRIGELTTQMSEQSRKREEGLHSVDMVLREKEHAAQAERLQLNAKVTDTVEDVNKRLLAKEMKLREEIQAKYQQLEKLLQREAHSRQEYEKGSREDAERKWQSLKKALEEELSHLKENISGERGRNKEALNKLDQSITILEKQLSENKKQVDKVMAAEIKSRKIHEAGTSEKIASVNEKLQIATSSLQQAIGGISQNLSSNNDKVKRDLKQMLNEQQQGSTRALSDMDVRLNGLKQRMANMEDMLDSKVSSASQNLSERMTDRLEAISKWQDSTGDTLRELGRSVQTLPQEIYQMEERMKLLKSEMDSRVSHESDSRSREVEQLRQDVASLKSRLDRQPKPASLQDLEANEGQEKGSPEMNTNVRKLADNLQTVKTVLGMKIQSEQKLRITGLEDLQSQINQVKILTGSSIKFQPTYRSQVDDLDTGLGWDDLGTLGTNTATPGTSGAEFSRQTMSDPKKPPPAIPEDREDSLFETKGGLKNMNIQSPTDRSEIRAEDSSPVNGGNQNFMDPGNATPDNWKSPRQGGNTRGNTPETNRSKGKGGTQTPETNRSKGKGGAQTPETNRSKGNGGAKSPGARSQVSVGGRSQGNRSAGGRSQGRSANSQRQQDSGLNDV